MEHSFHVVRRSRLHPAWFVRSKDGWWISYPPETGKRDVRVRAWKDLPQYVKKAAILWNKDVKVRSHKLRKALLKETKGRCIYCHQIKQLTVDHLVARSRGGSDHYHNLAPACFSCNTRRGNKPVLEHVHPRWKDYVHWKLSGCPEHLIFRKVEVENPRYHGAYVLKFPWRKSIIHQ